MFRFPTASLARLAAILLTILLPAALLHAAPEKRSHVVVIHGNQSIEAPGERGFALSLARHVVRWYREGGLAVDLADDKNLAADLTGRKVAVIVYCNSPDGKQMAALRAFTEQGGRLIVTFSISPALAKLMDVKQGAYLRAPAGHFASMRFISQRPVNIPPTILQSSANIITATPVQGKSKVLAWWNDRTGKSTGQAAWLQSDQGFWMTHVLLADGDSTAKGRLLVALAASLAPELWDEAARTRLALRGRCGPWKSPGDGLAKTAGLHGSPRTIQVRRQLQQADRTLREALRLQREGRSPEAWALSNELDRMMLDAYGLLQRPAAGEIHAVWDHSGQGLFPGDWPRTCRALKNAGITDIFVNVAGAGFAHCALTTLPRSPVYRAMGDQLAQCVQAAHPLGIRVHAWLICYSTTQATPARMDIYRREGWLLETTDGKTSRWLDPSEPGARAKIVSAGEELLTRYRIDGLHLDFVRYPDYYGSLGAGTRDRFNASRGKGRAVRNWPEDVKRGPLFHDLARWRATQVTALVADLRVMQRRKAPRALLTAAVLGKYPTCVESVGQDWIAWLRNDYIDFAVPMNYTENDKTYASLLATQLSQRRIARRVIGGIGVTASESRLDAAQVIDQIKGLRGGGAAGFALFDLDTTLLNRVLPVLRLGITAPAEQNRP